MEQHIYPGIRDPNAVVQHLLDTWDRSDTMAQAFESPEGFIVQVGQRSGGLFSDEPRSAVTLAIEPLDDGVRVTQSDQQWYRDGGGEIMVGGLIGFLPFFFTWPLSGGHDEAVDPELAAQVWQSIADYTGQFQQASMPATPAAPVPPEAAAVTGATTRLAEPATGETLRLNHMRCPTCGATNAPNAERCAACGTFLQARDCPQCGVANPATANFCMRCGHNLNAPPPANR